MFFYTILFASAENLHVLSSLTNCIFHFPLSSISVYNMPEISRGHSTVNSGEDVPLFRAMRKERTFCTVRS